MGGDTIPCMDWDGVTEDSGAYVPSDEGVADPAGPSPFGLPAIPTLGVMPKSTELRCWYPCGLAECPVPGELLFPLPIALGESTACERGNFGES